MRIFFILPYISKFPSGIITFQHQSYPLSLLELQIWKGIFWKRIFSALSKKSIYIILILKVCSFCNFKKMKGFFCFVLFSFTTLNFFSFYFGLPCLWKEVRNLHLFFRLQCVYIYTLQWLLWRFFIDFSSQQWYCDW